MPSKWNDRLVTNFLKVYKQHPCLWNPYHKDYYNCREKNDALRQIIDALGTPGFTVNDYLQQIRIIREKYKQEQARSIKCIQSQKQYKSPFPWYNIVAEMLTEVINEEEKANSERILLNSETRYTPSILGLLNNGCVRDSQRKEKNVRIRSRTDAAYDGIIRRSKSVEKPTRGKHRSSIANKNDENRANVRIRYVTCPQFQKKGSISQETEEDAFSSHRPTRDIEQPTVHEHPVDSPNDTTPSLTRESDKSYELRYLQCPACGWEIANYNQIARNAEKPIEEQKSFIPCSSYNKDPSGRIYSTCTGCDQVTRDDVSPETDHTKMNNSGDFEIRQGSSKEAFRPSVTNRVVKTAPARSLVEKAKEVADAGVQCDEVARKLSKDGIPTNIPVETQVFKLDPASVNVFQGGIVEACLKIMLSRSKGNLKENASPITQSTREIQCIRPESKTRGTQSSPKDIPEIKTNETGTNTVNYNEVGIQNTVCVSDVTTRAVSLHTQTDETEEEKRRIYNRNVHRTESKQVAVNMIDKSSKGIQSTVCVSRVNLCHSKSFDRAEIGTSTFPQQVAACVITDRYQSDYVPCVSNERTIPVARARSYGSINDRVWRADFGQSVEREMQTYKEPCRTDTCPGNMMNLMKQEPTLPFVLQKFLRTILSLNLQTDPEDTYRSKDRCTIDATEMTKKLKDAIRALESNVAGSEAKEFHQKFDANTGSQEVEGKATSIVHASTSTMIDESNLKPKFRSTMNEQDTETDTEFASKQLSNVDKEVSAYSSGKDVCINGSLLQLLRRDVEVQSNPQLKDPVCPDKCEQTMQNWISVGTQKRDPILVRIIKCNENPGIVRSDKETLTTRIGIDVTEKSIDKRVETCGRSTCMPHRKSIEANVEPAFHKKRDSLMDNAYRKRSAIYSKFICDENCKGRNFDWTNVTNIGVRSNNPNSKIPLGMKLRK